MPLSTALAAGIEEKLSHKKASFDGGHVGTFLYSKHIDRSVMGEFFSRIESEADYAPDTKVIKNL